MMWFDKAHPNALYVDIEERAPGCVPQQAYFHVKPDQLADFRDLPFPDKSFKLVVFDPPHLLRLSKSSIMRAKFGGLADTWRYDIGKGFEECWRVLDDHGTLIFKWCEASVPLKEVLALFPVRPLFGHPTAKSGKTIWCVFMKIPEAK